MAFDKTTGKRVWASANRDPAGHSGGPVLMHVDGVACAAVMTHNGLHVCRLDADRAGQTMAAYAWQTEFSNSIASPAVFENFVLITSAYNHGAICKLEIAEGTAKKVWESPHCSNVCTPVIHKGRVYWASQRMHCLDFATGEALWTGPANLGDAGSCIVAGDDRLVAWCDRGSLLLVETAERSAEEFKLLARHDLSMRGDVWPHAALSGGRLFLKDRTGLLRCLLVQ